MTGAVGGLLTLLTALVLGLLIWTAYGVFATQAGAVRSLAAQILQLDLALAANNNESTLSAASVWPPGRMRSYREGGDEP
jgi:hypothetical protein